MNIRNILCEAYLDWLNNYASANWINNYLTVELYAEHNGLTYNQASTFINLARVVYCSEHPEA